ncbi:MAG TPA: hypothetical protein VFJ96_03300 [Gemmatimonadaceae bacterium]|jgi:hypothetical protein|nr:hypothetical protein [Gemmatimonadaceae bacterium]
MRATDASRAQTSRHVRLIIITALAALLSASAACAPRAPALEGTVAPKRLPPTGLPPVHQKVIFQWTYSDRDFRAKGEGAARIAPPDSVRIDLFVGGGLGGASAVLIGDDVRISGDEQVRSYLPPVPLMWASLGRVAVPPAQDTSARVTGDTLRVDIGHDPRWRVMFVGDSLRRLDLIDGDRIRQWMMRQGQRVQYQQIQTRRMLDFTITRVDTVPAFDAAIWQ